MAEYLQARPNLRTFSEKFRKTLQKIENFSKLTGYFLQIDWIFCAK